MSNEGAQTLDWIRDFVVALKLCPFAAQPLSEGRVEIIVCDRSTPESIFYWAGTQVQNFLEIPASRVETVLLVIPEGLPTFEDFLGMVEALEDFLKESRAERYVQLAHFHPDYRFGDSAPSDPAHATNRSPYPTIQLLGVDSVGAAIAAYGETGRIPERNATLLRKLFFDESAGGTA